MTFSLKSALFGPDQRIKELADAWGAQLEHGGLVHSNGGETYRIQLRPGRKNSPPRLLFSIACASSPDLLLRRENWRDRLGKWLGLNREFDSGDPVFDNELYIETDLDDAILHGILTNGSRREVMRRLLESGITSIRFSNGGVELEKVRPDDEDFSIATAQGRLDDLKRIVKDLPWSETMRGGSPKWRSGLVVAISCGVILVVTIILQLLATSHYDTLSDAPIAWGLGIGALLWISTQLILIAILRGRSTSFRYFLISSLLLLPAMPLASTAGFTWYNGAFDVTTLMRHRTEITEKWISRNKNSRYYHIRVRDWSAQSRSISFTVNSDRYERVAEGSPVIITTRQGALGWEWIVAKEFKLN